MKILRAYPSKQCGSFLFGMVALLGGQLATFAVPGLIGVVVDAMKEGDQASINKYCLLMGILVLVSGFCVWARAATFNTISERIA